jgi:hypothetical protein
MAKYKCESCENLTWVKGEPFENASCWNPETQGTKYTGKPWANIIDAREICDAEGNGIFVHFQETGKSNETENS